MRDEETKREATVQIKSSLKLGLHRVKPLKKAYSEKKSSCFQKFAISDTTGPKSGMMWPLLELLAFDFMLVTYFAADASPVELAETKLQLFVGGCGTDSCQHSQLPVARKDNILPMSL